MASVSPVQWLASRRTRTPTSTSTWTPTPLSTPPPTATAPPAFDPAGFDPPLRTRLLVLQPTPFCNIDCSYCYLPQRTSTARMSLATVRLAARRLREDGLAGDALTVVWHAGEPLTVPPAFYDAAFAEIADALGPATRVTHSMQTNALLVDAAWCALFRRHGVRVGVSLDGPAALHDRHRRTRSGHGTHAAAMRGVAQLRDAGIDFHAIAVVTAATLAEPDAFFDFFAALGVAELGCNVDEAEGVHLASSLAGLDVAHAAFVERLLERSQTRPAPGQPAPPRVRELVNAWRLIADPLPPQRIGARVRVDPARIASPSADAGSGTAPDADPDAWPDNAQTLPFALVNVAHDGRFSTFSPELLGQHAPLYDDFLIGDVATSAYLDAARRSPAFARLWQAVRQGVAACRAGCAHFAYCGGGAPANKHYENGSIASAETLYCRSMVKRPFDAVLARLERDLASAAPSPSVGATDAIPLTVGPPEMHT